MGFYSDVLFPWGLDKALSLRVTEDIRRNTLAGASGNILEIGFGTGLNLPCYPDDVKQITTVDPNPGVGKRAQRRIDKSSIEVKHMQLGGESLPMDDATFDCVICTWTLCSIPEVETALQEVRRVMKPGAAFQFVEHGISSEPKVQRWQNRLNRVWNFIGDGCHLNRNPRELIQDCGLQLADCNNFYMDTGPRFAGYLYQGRATKV